jgi:hypothetical protein
MAEEKKEKWTTYLALTTVLIAVCATLSTFKGGGYGSKSLMNQTKASDQWAFYQAKGIKSYLFENQIDNLEIQKDLITKTPNAKETLDKYQAKIDAYKKKLAQYDLDKAEIKKNAEAFIKDGEMFKKHGDAFGIAVIFLQISILLSSIAALTHRNMVWYFSLLVGIAGVFYFFNGFFLFA